MLTGCTTPSASIESFDQVDLTAKTPRKVGNRGDGAAFKSKAKQARYELFPGAGGSMLSDGAEPPPGVGAQEDGTFTVNVDQATLTEAAKLILGETLGFNYVLDPRIQGSVTLVSNRPLTARELLSSFEAALRLSGAALMQTESGYKIVAQQEVLEGEMGQADFGRDVSAGYGVSAIPLRYISPATLMELMEGFLARSGSVRASRTGNLILIRGMAEERKSLVDIVLSFDVDWMKTQTASMATLENGRADDVAAKLQAVFAEDTAAAGANALKIIPVPSINGLIVIANSQQKVRRAIVWIKRLDQESLTDPNYYVYAVQNGNAVELARILQATFGDGGGDAGRTAEVAPDRQTANVAMDQAVPGQDPAQQPGAQPPDGGGELGSGLTTGSIPEETETPGTSELANGTRITPNPANNTLVIRATPKEYRKIHAMLRQIDAPAVQVLINTTIAEVALTDELRYGVQAYFKGQDTLGGFFGGDDRAGHEQGAADRRPHRLHQEGCEANRTHRLHHAEDHPEWRGSLARVAGPARQDAEPDLQLRPCYWTAPPSVGSSNGGSPGNGTSCISCACVSSRSNRVTSTLRSAVPMTTDLSFTASTVQPSTGWPGRR